MEDIFAGKKMEKIISAIEDILQTKVNTKKKSLLFLDEIQAVKSAMGSLRYFFEDCADLPVVAAGSLLEFLLNDHDYAMPVGRIAFLHMGPMTFSEFLIAKGEDYFLNKISTLTNPDQITENFHQRGLQLLREFMFIGGMPEAQKINLESGVEATSVVHSQLLETYKADFVKYAKKTHLQKIQKVFRYVYLHPCQKIKWANISRDDLSRDLKLNLKFLEEAKIVGLVKHSNCSGIPLEASEVEEVFKVIVLDVGLMNHALALNWNSFKNFQENELLIEGSIAEQFIGQHLYHQRPYHESPRLNYWLREGKAANAEVDFVLENESFLIAIEVKAGAAGKIRSLHQWHSDIKYKKKRAVRFNLSRGAREQVSYRFEEKLLEYELLTLPLYAVEWWKNFL